MGAFYLALTYIVRVLWKELLKKKMQAGGERSLLVVTTSDIAASVLENITTQNYEMFTMAGLVILDRNMVGAKIDGIPVVAEETKAAAYACRQWIDEVLVIPSQAYAYPKKLIDQLIEAGVTVHLNLAKVTDVSEKTNGGKNRWLYSPYHQHESGDNAPAVFEKSNGYACGLAGCLPDGNHFCIHIQTVEY